MGISSVIRTQPDSQKLQHIIDIHIKTNKIVIPAFQRRYIWSYNQICDLLQSIYRGYPIGSIIVWRHKKGAIDYDCIINESESEQSHLDYLLDGQQRIKSLYYIYETHPTSKDYEFYFDVSTLSDNNIAFLHENDVRLSIKKKSEDENKIWALKSIEAFEEDSDIKFKSAEILILSTQNVVVKKFTVNNEIEFLNLGLFNYINAKYLREKNVREWTYLSMKNLIEPAIYVKTSALRGRYEDYQIPIIVTYGELVDVIEIFDRINMTGTKLNSFDILVATTFKKDEFNLRWTMEEFLGINGMKKFFLFDNVDSDYQSAALILTRSISLITDDICSIAKKDLLKLVKEHFYSINFTAENFEKYKDIRTRNESNKCFIEAVEKTIDFFDQCKIASYCDVRLERVIIVLIGLFYKNLTEERYKANRQLYSFLKIWYWRIIFSDRYSEGSDKKAKDDFKKLLEIASNPNYTIENLDSWMKEEENFELPTIKKLHENKYKNSILQLLMTDGAKDLRFGDILQPEPLSKLNKLQMHHIFPQKYFNPSEISDKNKKLINSSLNFCFVIAMTNYIMDNKDPVKYLGKFKDGLASSKPELNYQEILDSNCIPPINNWRKDNTENSTEKDFTRFIDQRGKLLLSKIKEKQSRT